MEVKILFLSEISSFESCQEDILEIYVSSISKKEEGFLKNNSIEYEYIKQNRVKIILKNFSHYFVEVDKKNSGIYFEKTQNYFEILEEDEYDILDIKINRNNLVISKENLRVEILL